MLTVRKNKDNNDSLPAQDKESAHILNKYFQLKLKLPFLENGVPRTLYHYLKDKRHKNKIPPAVMPTGVHQLNFTWPIDESWARSMMLLFSPLQWQTDADVIQHHKSFHCALLELCGFEETQGTLQTVNEAVNVPIGLKHLVQAAYFTMSLKSPNVTKMQHYLKKNKFRLHKSIDAYDTCDDDEREEAHANANSEHILGPFNQTEQNVSKVDSEGLGWAVADSMETGMETSSNFNEEDQLFLQIPNNYNFHQAGRLQLRAALQERNISLTSLSPPMPGTSDENPSFEADLANVLKNIAKETDGEVADILPEAPLLHASSEQRAAIACVASAAVQRLQGHNVHPTRLKVYGEAGSGKSVVMRGQERLIKRLTPSEKRQKSVLGLAPTGAVSISMGSSGHTIHSIIPPFRAPAATKRPRTSDQDSTNNFCSEKEMNLSETRLSKLRAHLGFNTEDGTVMVTLLLLEEISMVGANLFWAIHCRLCQALERHDFRALENVFAQLDVVLIGDFNQLDPVCATSLVTDVRKVSGLNAAGIHLFQSSFSSLVLLKTQHRLNLNDSANARLRRLQLHVRDGALDDADFEYARSLDIDAKTAEEKAEFYAHEFYTFISV